MLKRIAIHIYNHEPLIINNMLEDLEDGFERRDVYDKDTIQLLAESYRNIIVASKEDPEREGLIKSPIRAAKAFQYLIHGYGLNPVEILKSALFTEDSKQIVVVKDIEIYSLCEHHLLPFFGKAHVGYIPNGKICGLSKIPRVVDAFARRLQLQERLTAQIKDCIQEVLNPIGVAVVIEAQHLCMSMRGIQKQNSVTTTSEFSGAFLKNFNTRQEFMHLIGTKLH